MLEESAEADGDQIEDADDAENDEVDGSIDYSTDLSEHNQTSILLDAKFTSCAERSVAVGRCFVEVCIHYLIIRPLFHVDYHHHQNQVLYASNLRGVLYQAEHDLTLANVRPLIIADKLVCSELCTLENEVEDAASCTTKAAAREGLEPSEVLGCTEVVRLVIEEDITSFLHELGWYFQTGISRLNDEFSAAYRVRMLFLEFEPRRVDALLHIRCNIHFSTLISFQVMDLRSCLEPIRDKFLNPEHTDIYLLLVCLLRFLRLGYDAF